MPAQRQPQRIVELGALAFAHWQLLEAPEQPLSVWLVSSPSCRVEPAPPRDIGLDVGVFFEQRNEAGQSRSHSPLVVKVAPYYLDAVRNALGQPARNLEVECVLHDRRGDTGSVEIVEGFHVGTG